MGAHMLLVFCFAASFQVIATVLNAPLVAWNVNKLSDGFWCLRSWDFISRDCATTLFTVPSGRSIPRNNTNTIWLIDWLTFWSPSLHRVINKNHMYDATEIFRTLGQHKKETFFKLGFYLITFFYYLYRFVKCLILSYLLITKPRMLTSIPAFKMNMVNILHSIRSTLLTTTITSQWSQDDRSSCCRWSVIQQKPV